MKPLFYAFASRYYKLFWTYPIDHTKSLFEDAVRISRNNSQIVLYRKGNLIYYVYTRAVTQNSFLGLCICTDYIFKNIKDLFNTFDIFVSEFVENGTIVKINNDERSCIVWVNEDLDGEQIVIDEISAKIENYLLLNSKNTCPLSPENFAISKDKCLEISVDINTQEDILEAINRYCKVYIARQKSDIEKVSSFNAIIRNKEEEIKQLTTENQNLNQQKRQIKYVLFLILVVIGCGIGIINLNEDLISSKKHLDSANTKINSQDKLISTLQDEKSSLNARILVLSKSLSSEKKIRLNAENELKVLKNEIYSTQPIIVTDIKIANIYKDCSIQTGYDEQIYSKNSMYLRPRITYIAIKPNSNITLYAKLYKPSGEIATLPSPPKGFSFSENILIREGSNNTYEFIGLGGEKKGFWPKGEYRYEIWYEDMCLKAKSFTLY